MLQFKPKGRFPSMDALTHSWPEELEPLVRSLRAPEGSVDVGLRTLAAALCGALDIPVYEDPVDSLHVLFTLFLEMKNNETINPQEPDALGMASQLNHMSFA